VTAPHTGRGDVAVLVPAAGRGERLGPGAPKALRELGGVPLLVHALRRLAAASCVGHIAVAAPPDGTAAVRALLQPELAGSGVGLTVVAGGAERPQSVAAALAAVPAGYDIILVHDAARAFTPPDMVDRVADAVRAGHPAVIPVLPVVDTVKRVAPSGHVESTVDRSVLRVVQTPQGFSRAVLAEAHSSPAIDLASVTDDAGMVEMLGTKVFTVLGDESALKITRPFDLEVAELLLARQS
jgi:2-C-methyl-D-erythritol 4-phosphate cytidylyltransferase